jgi:putative ABC transport system permease protein
MPPLSQNVRLGLRSLRRAPGFTATALLTLALGIGLATAVFSVAEAMLLRRLPVRDQERIVALWGAKRDGTFDDHPFDLQQAREFARRSRALTGAALFGYEGAAPEVIREADGVTRMRRALVSGNYFEVLGARPLLGRALEPSDDVRGAAPVVVLSYGAWQRRFDRDPTVIGRRLVTHADGIAHTIVGVMPQGLEYPRGVDVWAPLLASVPPENERYVAVDLLGRLAAGASVASARDELTSFFGRADATLPERELRGVARTLPRLVLGDTRAAVLLFAAASALLLVITCINVANLLLVRGLARVREVAVRAALGAGRTQVVIQLLIENSLLAVLGGALGVGVAAVAVRVFVAFAPAELPRAGEIRLDAVALAGAVGITAVATMLFALVPALLGSRVELQGVLRSGMRQGTGRATRTATEVLVVGQLALALLVLAAAALIGRSLIELERADLAFDPSRLLVAELALRHEGLGDASKQRALLDRLVPALEAIPGVRGVSPVVAPPFSGSSGWDGRFVAEGEPAERAAVSPILNMEVVSPSYFAVIGTPVVQGRAFTEADREGATRVVVLGQAAARYYWPGGDPIGQRLLLEGGGPGAFTVVGVVPDTRYRDLRDARPSIYFPLAQSFFPFAPTTLVVRTSGDPSSVVPAIRRVIGEVDAGALLASAAPFESFFQGPLAQPRLNALLLAIFAGAAAILGGVGLFGVMASMVRQRWHEFGVRMALGATTADIARLVLRRAIALAASGIALGLLGARIATGLLRSLLFGVSPTDALTLGVVVVALLLVSLLASLVPARASTRVQPASALRAE